MIHFSSSNAFAESAATLGQQQSATRQSQAGLSKGHGCASAKSQRRDISVRQAFVPIDVDGSLRLLSNLAIRWISFGS
jgi:hypothetical protein